jgi:rhamnogalacturonyl hydrolase YesR
MSFNECAGQKRRDGKRGTEEFGFWSYGAGSEAKDEKFIAANDWLNTRWDGNYYDFPRASMVAFWRSGKTMFWDVAQDSALHLADVDVAHANPGDPKLAGIEHTCPNRGHFRQWWGGEPFGISGNMDSTKCQSLYDIYHMTGDAWFLDVALLVTSYNMNHTGGALRAIGNRGLNLVLAYEQTGEKKYLDEAVSWMNKSVGGRGPTAKWDQDWMYGLPSEALVQIYRHTGDVKMAQTTVNCCDSLINSYWVPERERLQCLFGFTVICFGHAYEMTGNEAYLKKGLSSLKATVEEYAGGTKSFAQGFRISPYFLYYLTKDYQAPKPVIEKSNANK